MRSLLLSVLLATGCAHAVAIIDTPPLVIEDPREVQSYLTMRAVHKVTLTVDLGDGNVEKRELRGLIIIERSSRLRLRAYLPGNITLFDILVVGDKITIIDSLQSEKNMKPILDAIGDDLRAVYQLVPTPPEQKIEFAPDKIRLIDPIREIELSEFRKVENRPVFARAHVQNKAIHYDVDIEVTSVELNVELPEDIFKPW